MLRNRHMTSKQVVTVFVTWDLIERHRHLCRSRGHGPQRLMWLHQCQLSAVIDEDIDWQIFTTLCSYHVLTQCVYTLQVWISVGTAELSPKVPTFYECGTWVLENRLLCSLPARYAHRSFSTLMFRMLTLHTIKTWGLLVDLNANNSQTYSWTV